jgi:hypothetical protein
LKREGAVLAPGAPPPPPKDPPDPKDYKSKKIGTAEKNEEVKRKFNWRLKRKEAMKENKAPLPPVKNPTELTGDDLKMSGAAEENEQIRPNDSDSTEDFVYTSSKYALKIPIPSFPYLMTNPI